MVAKGKGAGKRSMKREVIEKMVERRVTYPCIYIFNYSRLILSGAIEPNNLELASLRTRHVKQWSY